MRERARFAPSPTGPLHIGGVRTALFNYLIAKKSGGKFILRIEDTDSKRTIDGAEKHIIDSLEWLGLHIDEGPIRQSNRSKLYKKQVDKLLKQGNAYYAFDSQEDLDSAREAGGKDFKYNVKTRMGLYNSFTASEEERRKRIEEGRYVVRLAIPENKKITVHDQIRGELTFNSNELEDKVILKSDGMPTYHLANVVDDNDMKITSVVRGEEWLSSLPVHFLLYEFFGWTPPKFYHLPLILKTSGAGKLSKRDADEQGHPIFAVQWQDSKGFKEHGFIPEGLNNYLAHLGWSNKEDKENYKMEELIEAFNYEEINKSGARFDFKKALWINHLQLKDLDSKRILDLSEQTKNLMIEKYNEHEAIEIIELIKERLNTTKDIDKELSVFVRQPKEIDVSAIEKINREVIFSVLNFCKLNGELVNNPLELKNELMKFGAENNISLGNIMKTLRLSLVGSLSGPDLFKIIAFIGPDETLQRIENLINKI
tara:strand:- start:541 stop:1989 length:1449 start_codon:yes stop_codon:yes gene_type:complete